ncbi:MAG: response regulator [Rudaea sp.]
MARILIIEDNPDNLELMTYLLESFGHAYLTAVDGEQGIEMARGERPDLILCDIHLPGMDGYTVARTLKSETDLSAIPILAVSARAMAGDHEKGLAAGFDGYISKPIDPENFVAQVDEFLDPAKRGSPPKRQTHNTPVPQRARGQRKARVVFLDDSSTNLELIRQTLAPSGYEVVCTQHIEQALKLARAKLPDIILSDLHMPDADGFEFVRQVKADPQLASIPFVFLSSSIWGERDRARAMQLGVTRFLVRPIEPQQLLLEIAAVLAGKANP